jgi:lysophospholipase L1-like esterase
MKATVLFFLLILIHFTAFNQYDFVLLNQSTKLDSAMVKLHQIVANPTSLRTANDSVFTIVHFGDSHIQGDYFSGEIRRVLQEEFGDAGHGVYFPYSLCKSWGPKGLQSTSNGIWTYSHILKPDVSNKVGFAGYELSTIAKDASLSFQFTENFKDKGANGLKIWYGMKSAATDFHLNSKFIEKEDLKFKSGWGIRTYSSKEEISGFDLSLIADNAVNSDFSFYGFELIKPAPMGINYHHCGVVGAQFTHLINNADLIVEQLDHLSPDILVFSFGTNEAYGNIDTVKYFNSINDFISKLNKLFPSTAIIITTAPDTRSQGKIPPSQVNVNNQLLKLVKNQDVSIFDLNKAMGGWGSLTNWYKSKLTLDDKLHFNAAGYALQGKMFSLALLESYNKNYPVATVDVTQLKSDILKVIVPVINNTPIPVEVITNPIIKKPVAKPVKGKVHIVKNGDTISKIAQKYHVSTEKILKLNRLTKNSIIRSGQKIKIP